MWFVAHSVRPAQGGQPVGCVMRCGLSQNSSNRHQDQEALQGTVAGSGWTRPVEAVGHCRRAMLQGCCLCQQTDGWTTTIMQPCYLIIKQMLHITLHIACHTNAVLIRCGYQLL